MKSGNERIYPSKHKLREGLDSKKRTFGVRDNYIADKIKLVKDLFMKVDEGSSDLSQELLTFLEHLKKEKIHGKQRFILLLYLFIELAYRRNKDVFLHNLYREDWGIETILSIFSGEINDEDTPEVMRRDPAQFTQQFLFDVYKNFLSQYPDAKDSIDICLNDLYKYASRWSLLTVRGLNESGLKKLDPRAYLMQEFLVGFLTMSRSLKNIRLAIEKLSENELEEIKEYYKSNSTKFNDDIEMLKDVALYSVSKFVRNLAVMFPNVWQEPITESDYKLVFDENGRPIIASPEVNNLIAERSKWKVLKDRLRYLKGKVIPYFDPGTFSSTRLRVQVGCPAAFHPIFRRIPEAYFDRVLPIAISKLIEKK